jgi:hypothetical protein
MQEQLEKVLGQQQIDKERLSSLAHKDVGERIYNLERTVHDLVMLGLEHDIDTTAKERKVERRR